jgi:hypothetical protein
MTLMKEFKEVAEFLGWKAPLIVAGTSAVMAVSLTYAFLSLHDQGKSAPAGPAIVRQP